MIKKEKLKKNKYILFAYYFSTLLAKQAKLNIFKTLSRLLKVIGDYRKLIKTKDSCFETSLWNWQLYINDKTSITPLDPVYFFQDTWLASNIFNKKPTKHVDIGSSAKTIGIISQFTPTQMVDIRPLPLELKGLDFIQGSITNLPYKDNSLESVSSICVIEHIGLGRYGDSIDAHGSEKAINELKRVVEPNGYLYISVPVDSVSTCLFNNCRTFTRELILELFSGFTLLEEKYQYGFKLKNKYDPSAGFGTGMFAFQKSNVE